MPVTTANTLRFSNVCQEIYGNPSTANRSLIGVHNVATGIFDQNFNTQGAVRTLLDFRGYSHVIITRAIVFVSYFSTTNHGDACVPSRPWTEGYNLFVNVPTFGQIVSGTQLFSTPNTSTTFNGPNGFYRLTDNNNENNVITIFQNQGSGIILSLEPCSIITNPLPPDGLYQSGGGNGTITASWSAMSNAVDYGVYFNGSFYGYTSGDTNFFIGGLREFQVYQVQITSINGSFQSASSEIVDMSPAFASS